MILIVLALGAAHAGSGQAAQVWTGPMINFTNLPGSDPTQATNQDRITPNVWITRATTMGIYNAKTETNFTHFFSPQDTAWADGRATNYASLTFVDWDTWAKLQHGGPPNTIGLNAAVHLVSDDIYLDVIFTSWGVTGGGFSYQRSTAPDLSPIVSIISPTNDAVFVAPAGIIVAAGASDAGGAVTNVEFFDNAASLGNLVSAPYGLLASLSVGTHSLTAVATDNAGLATTSAPVLVTVVSSITPNPAQIISLSITNKLPAPPLTITNVPIITNGLATFACLGDRNGKFDMLYSRSLDGGAVWNLVQANILGRASGSNVLSDPPYLASPAYPSNSTLFYRLRSLSPSPPPLALRLQVVASNFVSPIALTHAHDGSGRLFMADQVGQIRIVDNTGTVLPEPFLDISNRMVAVRTNYDERGLLGLAFHPGYSTNGRFFVYYAAPSSDTNFDDVTRISEFLVSSTNANVADPASERILLSIPQPESNHKGAAVVFGPDGYLYCGPGDGGGEGDFHGPAGNGQNLGTLLGKMIRIDVDSGQPYGIPTDNPFVGVPGARPEIYAYGLRNPWRFSFDRGGTHQCFVADVGQNLYEELDILRKGGNYGWRIMEGFHNFDIPEAAALGVNISTLDFPIFEYHHGPLGISIIGGFVYRGAAYPALVGKYVFGDFSTSFDTPDGQIYYLDQTRPGIWELFGFQLLPTGARFGRFIKGWGEDETGELYVLSTGQLGPNGTTGDVCRLLPP